MVITRGKSGSLFFDGKNYINCPAFANKVIDKVGAGDSFLSLFSLGIPGKNNTILSMLLGSIAGAYNVENIANSKYGKSLEIFIKERKETEATN